MGNSYTKQATTIAQQINVLKERGLIIEDDVEAGKVLDIISYFRLADYWRFMEEDSCTHQFKQGSRWEYVTDSYYFDKELKVLLFSAIQSIEVSMRAKIIKHFTPSFGAFWFMQPEYAKDMDFFHF